MFKIKLSLRKNLIPILFLAVLALVAGSTEYISSSASDALTQSTQNENNLQLQILTLDGQLKHLMDATSNQSVQNVTQLTAESLPSSSEITNILTNATTIAVKNHVSVQSLSFNDQVPASKSLSTVQQSQESQSFSLSTMPYVNVNLTVAGTNGQIFAFINELEHMPRISSIQSFSLSNDSVNARETATINLWEYYMPSGKV